MDRYDIIAAAGLILLSAGFYFWFAPLGLIVPGVLLFAVGVLAARGSD